MDLDAGRERVATLYLLWPRAAPGWMVGHPPTTGRALPRVDSAKAAIAGAAALGLLGQNAITGVKEARFCQGRGATWDSRVCA
jgi:hypothetical protein